VPVIPQGFQLPGAAGISGIGGKKGAKTTAKSQKPKGFASVCAAVSSKAIVSMPPPAARAEKQSIPSSRASDASPSSAALAAIVPPQKKRRTSLVQPAAFAALAQCGIGASAPAAGNFSGASVGGSVAGGGAKSVTSRASEAATDKVGMVKQDAHALWRVAPLCPKIVFAIVQSATWPGRLGHSPENKLSFRQ
jgi:hypothetical protein